MKRIRNFGNCKGFKKAAAIAYDRGIGPFQYKPPRKKKEPEPPKGTDKSDAAEQAEQE